MISGSYKIILVAGARPNFMKIAPLMHRLRDHSYIDVLLVHTGQHYDEKMSKSFFDQLNIPKPTINLEVGSSSHAVQTARIMEGFEEVCLREVPNLVIVVGDVNSTAACSMVAAKLNIAVAHYEAGLRSRDRRMPEEINRLITDAITDLYFTTSIDASENLFKEGVSEGKVHMLGNLMIDSLVSHLKQASQLDLDLMTLSNTSINNSWLKSMNGYIVMTFHRPSNVDDKSALGLLVEEWVKTSNILPLLFPVHPRTQNMLKEFGLMDQLSDAPNIHLLEPLSYLEFLSLVSNSSLVITDSGGIQEETTFLKIPCLTVRPTTERPVTIWEGSNQLIKAEEISTKSTECLRHSQNSYSIPRYWDGDTADRIVKQLEVFAQAQGALSSN